MTKIQGDYKRKRHSKIYFKIYIRYWHSWYSFLEKHLLRLSTPQELLSVKLPKTIAVEKAIFSGTTHAVLNKSWKQHPTNSSYTTIYLPFHKPSQKGKQNMLGTTGEGQTHKQHSPTNSYTCQCWLSSKNLHSSALCRHRVQSRRLTKCNSW